MMVEHLSFNASVNKKNNILRFYQSDSQSKQSNENMVDSYLQMIVWCNSLHFLFEIIAIRSTQVFVLLVLVK